MADGSAPDITQQLLQMQSMINSSQGGGKRAFLFGVIPLDWEANAPFAMQSLSPIAKNIPAAFGGTGKSGGLADKFLQAIASIPEDLRKRASEAGVMYSGPLPEGSMPGSSGISGGGIGSSYGGMEV